MESFLFGHSTTTFPWHKSCQAPVALFAVEKIWLQLMEASCFVNTSSQVIVNQFLAIS